MEAIDSVETTIAALMAIGDARVAEEQNYTKRIRTALGKIADFAKDIPVYKRVLDAYRYAIGRSTLADYDDNLRWCETPDRYNARIPGDIGAKKLEGIGYFRTNDYLRFEPPKFLLTEDGTLYESVYCDNNSSMYSDFRSWTLFAVFADSVPPEGTLEDRVIALEILAAALPRWVENLMNKAKERAAKQPGDQCPMTTTISTKQGD